MPEAVRLVIWDLDDTLWKGTLVEGAITRIPETEAILKELARRGIMSAICSRNDLAQVRNLLLADGLWNFFVFPSINWEAKGPRIRSLVEDSQLRPETVLFIDDNPSNLEEAKYCCPGIQTAGVDVIAGLLSNPLLQGKDDAGLTRLQQYKALEHRRADLSSNGEGVEAFLRHSNIRVQIQFDLSDSLGRVIELINRTNQLNFTKRRLAEDNAAAHAELEELLQSHEIQAGLLHVADRYGDHGDSGFYMLRNGNELLHFCFSCRILGMGIETWLYRKLGRPQLKIAGEVLSNPVRDTREVDWISLRDSSDPHRESREARSFDWVAARGGCDLQALSHYFHVSSAKVFGEFNVGRSGFDARVDHSIFLRYAVAPPSHSTIIEAAKLGYRPEDFRSVLTEPRGGAGLVILSCWADASYALYQHKQTGLLLPFAVSGRSNHTLDARTATPDELPEPLCRGWMASALETLKNDYDFVGVINEDLFKENLRTILAALPAEVPVLLLQTNTRLRDSQQGVTHTSTDNLRINRWLAEVASEFPTARVMDIRKVIYSESEVLDWSHFDRIVYYRLYEEIRAGMR